MTEQTRQVALPAYLPRRLQAFRVVRGDKVSYVLRDKLADRTYDIEQWQFFVLEVLPGCEDAQKLLSVFSDRFGREISEREVMGFFAHLADNKLLDEESAKHPLLQPFTRTGYALEQGLIKPKSFEELAVKMATGGTAKTTPSAAAAGRAGAGGRRRGRGRHAAARHEAAGRRQRVRRPRPAPVAPDRPLLPVPAGREGAAADRRAAEVRHLRDAAARADGGHAADPLLRDGRRRSRDDAGDDDAADARAVQPADDQHRGADHARR